MSASTTSGKTESSAAPPDAYNALVHKTALDPSEVETWVRAAENMYVPYDEKLKIILHRTTAFLTESVGTFGTHRPNAIRYCYFTTRSTSIGSK
jgi:hypothetical protein